ncbi:hypothetical protein [Nocardioides pacificus]
MLPSPEEQDFVAQLTRDVLQDAAPEEMGVFSSDERAWLEGTHRSEAPHDDLTAFGVEGVVVVLTPYVVAAATAAVRYLTGVLTEAAGEELRPRIKGWVRRLFGHDGESPDPVVVKALSLDVVRRVREVTLSTCLDLGLERADADLVSDAVAGRLAVPVT